MCLTNTPLTGDDMELFSQQTPDGRTIAAQPDPGRHVAQPPGTSPYDAMAGRSNGSTLVAFVSGSIAVLPQLPGETAGRVCLQLFLVGAADRFWARYRLHDGGFLRVVSGLLARHGLPGNETAALIEALPELRQDPGARRIMQQGADELDEWLDSRDNNVVLRLQELMAGWRRNRFCRERARRA